MFAARGNHAGVVKLLLKRGADGTAMATVTWDGYYVDVRATTIDIARAGGRANDPGFAETLAVLRLRCCSKCGMTSPGLSVKTAGAEQHLKRCGNCPARGPRARYCSKECQRADWVPRDRGRCAEGHRGECAEARRARQAAGTVD